MLEAPVLVLESLERKRSGNRPPPSPRWVMVASAQRDPEFAAQREGESSWSRSVGYQGHGVGLPTDVSTWPQDPPRPGLTVEPPAMEPRPSPHGAPSRLDALCSASPGACAGGVRPVAFPYYQCVLAACAYGTITMTPARKRTTRTTKTDEGKLRTWSLNVFLIRHDLKADSSILTDLRPLSLVPLALPDGTPENLVVARLYFARRSSQRPKWAVFFGDLLAGVDLPGVASAPAILLVPVDERLMAVAFSFGSALLEAGSFDPTFGLRVALNSVKPGKVRSYDKRTFDALFRQTREQAASETNLESFGIDAERDLVRTISGRPADKTLGTSMAGGSSLHASVKTTPNRLVHYLRRLYNKSTGKLDEQYRWLGRIEEVLDHELQETLDSYLDDRLRANSQGVWLAVPEIMDWPNASGFRFIVPTRSKSVYPDLHWRSLSRALRSTSVFVGVEFLRAHRVELLDGNDTPLKRWKLYDCLNAEIIVGHEAYVLSAGAWYKVDSDLIAEIDREVGALELCALPLPDFDVCDKDERAYNLRVASLMPKDFCCLDSQDIMFGGGRSRFEVCDLLHSSGALLHVKRYGGSSALSYLFAQGLMSADLLMKRPSFRENADLLVEAKKFSALVQKSFGSKQVRDVVYVVIGGPANSSPCRLPLFAKVNLRNAVRSIRAFGWDAKIQYVGETELRVIHSRKKRSPG
jgi:uncharacterized protein (TIGR04141 family)